MASQQDLEHPAGSAEKHDLIVHADEYCEQMINVGRQHRMFAALPAVGDHNVLVRSFTKTFAMPEWRMGNITGPAPIMVGRHNTLHLINLRCNHVCKWAAWAAGTGPQDRLAGDGEFQADNDSLCEAVQETPGIYSFKLEGGPIAWIDVSQLKVIDDQVCDMLCNDYGIVATARHYFDVPVISIFALAANRQRLTR